MDNSVEVCFLRMRRDEHPDGQLCCDLSTTLVFTLLRVGIRADGKAKNILYAIKRFRGQFADGTSKRGTNGNGSRRPPKPA